MYKRTLNWDAPLSKSIESDLKTLRTFSEYNTLGGTHTMLWFYALLRKYPLEYLIFSRDTPFHKPYREKVKEELSSHRNLYI